MAAVDNSPNAANPLNQDDEHQPGEGSTPPADSGVGSVLGEPLGLGSDEMAGSPVTSLGDADLLADNEMLAATTSFTPDVVANIEQTLDQLTSTTDLFDVPALDFDSGADG
jgi:hypothetical protein